uniref:Uncharacterized protein n=1 Tax=Aegilops tauschii subsp. strangulata TaxID=200361 RepID=A0A453EHN4_AEGTS
SFPSEVRPLRIKKNEAQPLTATPCGLSPSHAPAPPPAILAGGTPCG